MPSKSKKQARFMAAVAHGWKPSSRKAPPLPVAREFNRADVKTGILKKAEGGKVEKKKKARPKHKLDPPPKRTTLQRFADMIEGFGADNESRKSRRRMAAGLASQWWGVDPKTGKPGSPLGIDLDLKDGDLDVNIRRPGIVDETMALPILGEIIADATGSDWKAPEWAHNAERRNYERGIAINRELGIDNPRGLGENFDETLGVMLGQIPVPGRAAATGIKKGAGLVKNIKNADLLKLAKKYEPGVLEYLMPTIEARPQNYLIGSGAGAGMASLGEQVPMGYDFMRRHGGPRRATGGLMRSSDFGVIVEPRGVSRDLKHLKHKYADGGKVAGTARAVKAIKDAIHHLDNKDVSSAATTLRASGNRGLMAVAERLRVPEIQSRLRKMGAGDKDELSMAKGGKVGGIKDAIERATKEYKKAPGSFDPSKIMNPPGALSLMGRARQLIFKAEKELGALSQGQKVDLLLDNMPDLKNSAESRELVKKVETSGFAKGGKVEGIKALFRVFYQKPGTRLSGEKTVRASSKTEALLKVRKAYPELRVISATHEKGLEDIDPQEVKLKDNDILDFEEGT